MLGCCGVIYQTKRDGRCPGRRLLTIYELLLIGIFVGQGYVAVDLLGNRPPGTDRGIGSPSLEQVGHRGG